MSIIKTLQTATSFAQKKLLGKAHTSNLFSDSAETIVSSVQAASLTIFGESIPNSPSRTLYNIDQSVEYIEFDLVALSDSIYDANETGGGSGSGTGESSQIAGAHAYAFKLPSTYESNSSSSRAGTGNFTDSKLLYESGGNVQIVPPNFSLNGGYEIHLFKANGDQIPLLSQIDWQVDTYNGIMFVQDYEAGTVPVKARAFIYIGKMIKEVVEEAAESGGNDHLQSTSASYLSMTGSLSLSGQNNYNFNTTNVGTDTFFFVSGSIGGKELGEGVSVFGGDLVVSGNLLIPSEASGLIDSQEIRHQYIDQEYSGSYSTNIGGKLYNKSLKSPVYAKSNDENSDLFNFLRASLYPRSQAAYELLLSNKTVFKELAYIDDGSGNFTQQNGYFNFSFDKSIGYLKETIDENTGAVSFINEDVDLNNTGQYFFDSQGPQNVTTFIKNSVTKNYSSFAAEVRSNFNHGFKYILEEYTVNAIKSAFESTLSISNTTFNVTYTNNPITSTPEITGIVISDSNSNPLYTFDTGSNYQIYLQNELNDLTKKILNDVNNTTLLTNYRNTIIAGGVTPLSIGKLSNRYMILFSKYLNEGNPEYIKTGTKVSVNRWEALKTKYASFNISASIINNIFKKTSASDSNPLINFTTLFGCLKTLIYSYNKAINDSAAATKPLLISSANYSSLNWTLYNLIDDANNNLEVYDLRLLLVPAIKKLINDVYVILNTTVADSQYADFLTHSDSVSSFSNSVSSNNTNTTILKVITNVYSAEIGFSLNRKLNGDRGVYTLVKEYDEYLFYKSLHFNSVGDVSERDFAYVNNRKTYNVTTAVLDAEDTTQNKETLIKNRYTILSAYKPALIANGTSLFMGPVSISKLYGQSPIQVNTEFVFGNTLPVLNSDGTFLTGSEGEVLTSSSNQLKIGSKGFEGDLQITGSLDITGFGPSDGVRINMGNLIMTNDQDGFNMPQFNMINTNSQPFEAPQILLSNNINSFASGTKSYEMGEISFAGPREDSPSDDKENIKLTAMINESTGSSSVNYLSYDVYVNDARNRFKNLDNSVPLSNKFVKTLVVGQFGDSSVENENQVSVGIGVRGNVLPLGIQNHTDDSSIQPFVSTDNTLGTTNFRWGGLHLGENKPITFGNTNITKSKMSYDTNFNKTVFSGSVGFSHGLSGSLTTLLDGTQFIKGINGIDVLTGSNGSITIALDGYASGSNLVTSDIYSETGLTGSIVNFNQSTFELAGYNDNNIKFYLNGQLLTSGSSSQIDNNERDYFIESGSELVKLSATLDADDILSAVYYNDTSDQRGQFRYDRILSEAQPAGTNVWFNFDFRTIDNSYDKFEVFINGQHLARIDNLAEGDVQPYTITATNRIQFVADLYQSDIITLLFKIPSPFTASGNEDEEENTLINSKIKITKIVTPNFNALVPISFTNIPFDLDAYSKDVLTVYLNGQLLLNGTESQTTNGTADYYIVNSSTVKFADVISSGDVVTFDLLVPGSLNANSDTVFITSNKSLLNNTLQLTSSSGIEIVNSSNKIEIKNSKQIVFNELLSGSANGSNQVFGLLNDPFSSEEISIFVNGELKTPQHVSNNYDYFVSGSIINFNASATPISGSLVLAIYNKVT